MALTPEQRAARKGKLTASQVGILMEGDAEKIYNLWCEHTEHEDYAKDDLSHVWPVQLGSFTELLSLEWYSRGKGYGPLVKSAQIDYIEGQGLAATKVETFEENPIKKMGEIVTHPDFKWVAATLDAFDTHSNQGIVVECKHCGNFRKLPDIITKYTPQLHWQMFATGTREIILWVIIGANEPVPVRVEWDEFYWQTLWHRAQEFWKLVESKTPPSGKKMTAVAAITVPKTELITIDLPKLAASGQAWPNWAGEMINHLNIWADSNDAAAKCEKAKADVKKLLPDNVGKLIHEGVQVVRDGRGVTLKEVTGE
jgi:hypothetical protein